MGIENTVCSCVEISRTIQPKPNSNQTGKVMNSNIETNLNGQQFSADQTHAAEQTAPAIVEELTIDELAVREEYAACYTVK